MRQFNVRYIPFGEHEANGTCTIEAAKFADVEGAVHKEFANSVVVGIEPAMPPEYGAWIEMRRGSLWFVTQSDARKLRAADFIEAASHIRDEAFMAMLFANAIAGTRTADWALVHTGYTSEKLDRFVTESQYEEI